MRQGVYHLVPDSLSEDTIDALHVMHSRAKQGQILGIAYVVMYKRREFATGATGECRNNPIFTRGMVASLDDALATLINGN